MNGSTSWHRFVAGRGSFAYLSHPKACLEGLGRSLGSTTGLDLQGLEAQAPPEVMPSGVALVLAAPGGPVKPVVKGLVVVAGQVEQAADLGDGQRDQAALAAGPGIWRFVLFMPVRGVCPAGRRGLSTGRGSPF